MFYFIFFNDVYLINCAEKRNILFSQLYKNIYLQCEWENMFSIFSFDFSKMNGLVHPLN